MNMQTFFQPEEPIRGFFGQYRWLSNFWKTQIVINNWIFSSAEHAYQAAKSLDPTDWRKIQDCSSAGQAKRTGKYLKLRPDWEQVKVQVMLEILEVKFQHPNLREWLLETGTRQLIEENQWGDTFWGVCNGKGQNMLGYCLMEIRSKIKEGKKFE